MTWDKGWNFRGSAGYVTDGTDETYVIASDTSPQTRIGATFQLDIAPGGAIDYNSGIDRRLAGWHEQGSGSGTSTLIVTLPAAGSWLIRLAVGCNGFTNDANIIVKDDTSTLFSIAHNNINADTFYDATDVARTSAALWVANNASRTETFATTTFKLLNIATNNRSAVIAHLFLSQVGGGGGFVLFPRPRGLSGGMHRNSGGLI